MNTHSQRIMILENNYDESFELLQVPKKSGYSIYMPVAETHGVIPSHGSSSAKN